MKTYEIYDLTANEMLADNLSFDEVPELFGAYYDFYVDHEIIVCCRTTTIKRAYKVLSNKEVAFRLEWFDFVEELVNIGNLY